jgi:hypothetical protein
MSNIVQGLVWQAEIPNAIGKLIAVKLADWADDDGGSIYPSVPTVAQMTACGQTTVRAWLRAFEKCGLLKVVSRSKGGARTDTTERAFDLDLLRRLAWTRRGRTKVPPELRLVQETKRGGKEYGLTLAPFAAGAENQAPNFGVVDGGQPLRQPQGSDINTPAAAAGLPLRQPPTTPAAAAPDLSSIHHCKRSDPSNLNLDDRKRRPAQVPRFVSEAALDKVKAIAPGWDRQMLLRKFLDWEGSKNAQHMDAAFLGWAKRFTRGKAA